LPWTVMPAARGMADHDDSTRLRPPLVCCIRLFYSAARSSTTSWTAVPELGQIVRPIHSTAFAYATREGVARRLRMSLQAGMAVTPPECDHEPPDASTLTRAQSTWSPDSVKAGRGIKPARSNPRSTTRPAYVAGDSRLTVGGGAACASDPEPARRVHTRDGFRFVLHPSGVEHRG